MRKFFIAVSIFILIVMFTGLLRGFKTVGKSAVRMAKPIIKPVKPKIDTENLKGLGLKSGTNVLKDGLKKGVESFDSTEEEYK